MSKADILIVEDESIVALDIKRSLQKLNFNVVDIANNFESAIKCVRKYYPEIILMDINLGKGKDGIETARAIQNIKNIPVIYLTAYSDEVTINRAVETNPIGYLLKPFKREELKSVIILSLYKIKKTRCDIINNELTNLGDGYFFDKKNRLLYFNEHPIKLGVKEKLFLSILVEAKGNIVSFSDLEFLIWPDSPVSDSTLRTLIYRLRSKLNYKIIETFSSIGCKIKVSK